MRSEARVRPDPVRRMWHRLPPGARAGALLIVLLVSLALGAPLIARDPSAADLSRGVTGPSAEAPLGTDRLGRDVWSRLVYGARISLGIGILVPILGAALGSFIGLVAGYYGGLVDDALMRLVDIRMGFPTLVFVLAMAGALGPGLVTVAFALVILGWVPVARVVRGEVLSLKERDFVMASHALGASNARTMFRHVLPHTLGTVLVLVTLDVPHTILQISTLGFLGLGAQPPTAEWGTMLNAARPYMRSDPLLMIAPGLMIFLSTLAFTLLGNGLQEVRQDA